MPDGIRLDLQEALARGPSGIPNLEPLFAPGAIPPIFPEGPEEGFIAGAPAVAEGPGFVPGGGPPSGATGTLPGEPIDIGNAPIGQPVPPIKPSRGERLRRLLGNFLQNFGEGLQAASRAPSGAEFAAGFGGALSAPEERRRQQVRESLLQANQALRQQIAVQNARFRQETLDAEEGAREAARIKEDTTRRIRAQERFEERAEGGTRRAAGIQRRRKERAEDKAFAREEGESEFLRRLRLKRTASGGKSGATKFPEAERKRLAESIALQVGLELPGTGPTGQLSATGGFKFRLQLSKIGTKIDRIVRAGGSPEEVFALAIDAVRRSGKPVNLDNVLAVISDRPRR